MFALSLPSHFFCIFPILFQSLYQMIRFLSIFLLMVYALTSSGATVYYHECGQRSQISLSDNNSTHQTCRFCTEREKNHEKEHHCHEHNHLSCDIAGDCCKDVQIELKNSEEQLTSNNIIKDMSMFAPAEIILYWIVLHTWVDTAYLNKGQYVVNSAPPLPSTDTYLINCNFRI